MIRLKMALAIGIVAAVVTAAAAWLGSGPQPASERTCAVYRSYFNPISKRRAVFLNPTSRNVDQFFDDRNRIRRDNESSLGSAPKEFFADEPPAERTGDAFLKLLSGSSRQSHDTPIQIDTTSYFETVSSGPAEDVRDCFAGADRAPMFSAWPFRLLEARETMSGGDEEGLVTLWTVSPVGFSEDGRFALLYSEYCSVQCAVGEYRLFTRRDGEWMLVGSRFVWAS